VIPLEPRISQTLQLELTYAASRQPEGTPVCRVIVPYLTERGQWLTFTDETVLTAPAD
jgi:hypothetical protein